MDGDELLHRNLVGLQEDTDWGDQIHTLHVNDAAARRAVTARLEELVSLFQPRRTVVAFSGEGNFRRALLPTYKSNRWGSIKPLCFAELKAEFLVGGFGPEFTPAMRDGLEADDVLGILATKPGNEDHVLVSVDKDFKTVPCNLYREWGDRPVPYPRRVSEEEADAFHLFQTLAGDASDGYGGCPRVGEVTAAKLLDGQPRERWWTIVVAAYAKRGLTEEDALVQARVARILRWQDYDSARKEPILWTPGP